MLEEYSLPPLITDVVQGRLDMIIMRPTLLPALQSEQILEFRYSWWGSKYIHKIRLYPGCDEIRTVYDVRCDLKGLQRYLVDAEYLTVEMSVASDSDLNLQHTPHEHQMRRIKEWKIGDNIGKFSLPGLKLNARGEYCKECNILNTYGDHLGSVLVFILYTSGDEVVSAPSDKCKKENHSLRNISKIPENIQTQLLQAPQEETKGSRENSLRSPRFVSFNKNKSSIKCKILPQKISKHSKKNIENVKNNQAGKNDLLLKSNEETNSKIYPSLSVSNEKHILTRLFSFVDSGALQPSDLPTLIQIYQGRSPSLELDSYECLDDQTQNMGNDHVKPMQKVVFNEEFLKSFGLNEDAKTSKYSVSDSISLEPPSRDRENLKEVSVNTDLSDPESSLMFLVFHSVQLIDQTKNNVTQPNKRILVRQRSKLCYFVEVILETEETENFQSALFVSRQITERQEIVFNSRKIFKLQYGNGDAYLKFKVSRRYLGNRQREPVGLGIASLNQIRSDERNENYVHVSLWASSGNSNSSKTNRNTEKPIGSLVFRLAFAVNNMLSQFDAEESMPQIDECNKNLFISSKKNLSNLNTLHPEEPEIDKNKIISSENNLQMNENKTNLESIIIETKTDVKYIPTENADDKSVKTVHLEILEGNGLPLLRSKRSHISFHPNSYILTSIPHSCTLKTNIIRSSSSPVWNYRTSFCFHREDFEHTNYKLIMKLFHSMDGENTQSNDPFLGFAMIDINFLWSSFLSLCGWIPLLDLDGNVCGEIKVSLTPKKSKDNYREKTNMDKIECEDFGEKANKYVDSFIDSREHPRKSPNLSWSSTTNVEDVRNGLANKLLLASESSNGQPAKFSSYESSPVKLKIEEELVEEPVEFKKASDAKDIINPAIIESMQWMNHVGPLDSPCVSYLDLCSNTTSKEILENQAKKTNRKPNSKRKSRIAANLNFLHNA